MDILIQNATIVDPNSEWNGKQADILIRNGRMEQIGTELSAENIETYTAPNLHVSPGWFDLRVNFQEPGHEYKEDLESGSAAAMRGGFTGVALMPSTIPSISNKSSVEFVRNRTAHLPLDVYPCGTITDKHEGAQLAEMYDMQQAGAVAFTDDKQPIAHAGLMSKALLYAKNFDGLIQSFPFDQSIQLNGQMNEGVTSTLLGLEGIPTLAEELQVARDLYLTEYNDAKIHFSTISTPRSLDLIAEAKEDGLQVTCDTTIHHLVLTDEALMDFDSNYKVMPPLRNEDQRLELLAGLKEGTIDVICSDHTPEDIEHKKLEFGEARFGIIGLESFFGLAATHLLGILTLDQLIAKIAINPRTILKLDVPIIREGFEANLTLFDPDLEWTFDATSIQSKSKNSPFIGATLTGKALAIYNHQQLRTC